MQERPRQRHSDRHGKRKISTAKSVFGSMAEAGHRLRVVRDQEDLPNLIPLWPHELVDHSPEGCRHLLAKLRSAEGRTKARSIGSLEL